MAKKLTKAKAREILHDKEVHGHPLTDKQRKFFGAVASGYGWLNKYENGGFAQEGEQVRPQILQQFEDYRTSPEGKEYFRMMEENRIAKKRSGRVEYSDVDPITDVIVPMAGIAGTVGKQASKKVISKLVKPSVEATELGIGHPIGSLLWDGLLPRISRGELPKEGFFRKIGDTEGLKDLIESGIVRTPPKQSNFTGTHGTYFSQNNPIEDYAGRFLVHHPGEGKITGNPFYMDKNFYVPSDKQYPMSVNPVRLDDPLTTVYKRNFMGTGYKKIDKDQLEDAMKGVKSQSKWENNLLRPVVKWATRYGVGKTVYDNFRNGGMQEYQENYNQPSISYPPNFVGMSNNTQGFDYNSAWGGRWKNGGQMNFLQPTSEKLPKGYRVPYNIPSTERAISVGGEGGEPAYLIPSFKYGEPLKNPIDEFRKTKDYLGGPFKTWQEADQWDKEIRHPYVEKGQDIPTPLRRWGKDFEMGGTLPGAVGFQYARHGAPSEGKYAKKTLPSAAFGGKMTYYQNGLDFEPKTISEDGGKFIGGPGAKRMIANAIEEYNLPENIEARRMQSAKERAAKISGRIDYSEIDPITDVALPILSAPGVAKGLFSGAENITEELLKSKVASSKTFDKVGNMLRNVKKTITPTYHKEASTQLQKANQYLRDWYTDPATLEKLRKTTYNYEESMANRFGVSPNDARVQEQIANTIAERETLFTKRINEGNADIQYNPVLKNIWNKYIKGEQAKVSKGARGTSWTDKETLRSSNYVRKALNPRQRGNTMVHEGSHGADAGGELFNQEEIELLQGGFDTRQDSEYAQYLLDPTEIRARKQQIFYNENLRPDAKFSKEQIDNIIQKGLEGKYRIDPEWFQLIDSPKSFGKMMNEMWGTVPVAVGAGIAAQQQRDGGVTKDNMGYWNPDNWGKPVEIDSNQITMQGVNQSLLGISDTGDAKIMKPGKDYRFKGNKVTELPIAAEGASFQLDKLDQLTNFTNYNKPTRGGWLDKYQ